MYFFQLLFATVYSCLFSTSDFVSDHFQMFKGFEKVKDVQYVYTPFDSSLCGVKLEANNKKQYLLTGKV